MIKLIIFIQSWSHLSYHTLPSLLPFLCPLPPHPPFTTFPFTLPSHFLFIPFTPTLPFTLSSHPSIQPSLHSTNTASFSRPQTARPQTSPAVTPTAVTLAGWPRPPPFWWLSPPLWQWAAFSSRPLLASSPAHYKTQHYEVSHLYFSPKWSLFTWSISLFPPSSLLFFSLSFSPPLP